MLKMKVRLASVLAIVFAPLAAHASAWGNNLRENAAYSRARAVCTEIPGGQANLIYIRASMAQTSGLMGFDVLNPQSPSLVEQWRNLLNRRYYVSPLLASDLQSEAFQRGLQDCGLGISGQDRIVISLIADDLLGKMLFMVPFAKSSEYGWIGFKMFADWLWRVGTPAKIMTLFSSSAAAATAYHYIRERYYENPPRLRVRSHILTPKKLKGILQTQRIQRNLNRTFRLELMWLRQQRARTTDQQKKDMLDKEIKWIQNKQQISVEE